MNATPELEKLPPSRAIEATAIYSIRSAAYLLEMHPDTVRKRVRLGLIKGSRRCGDWRIKGAELLKLA